MKSLNFITTVGALATLGMAMPLWGQTTGFTPSLISSNGILTVQATDTYYDGSDGTLFVAVPLPAGASRLQFRVTGGVITDGSDQFGSADGLYADGRTPYNWTATAWNGTYHGTRVGATTGIDPALFGVFFKTNFVGTPANSLNSRSDSGLVPDPRTRLSYAPLLNQPFYIGDGYNSNNAYFTNVDSYIPPGTNQTFEIPAGATHLLLGIGADVDMNDNQNASNTNSAFVVHVFDDNGSPPVIATVTSPGAVMYQGASGSFSVLLASGAAPLTYQWLFNNTDLTDNAHVSGSQSNVLSLINMQPGDSGVYQVVVSNSLGYAVSNVLLTVVSSGQPVVYNLSIPANAEIHGAGNAGLPDPGGGVYPVLINLPANALVVTLSNVSGTISLNGGGGHNDADGVLVSGGSYPSYSFAYAYGGVSGIRIPGAGALVGVFEPPTAPTSSAPTDLDFTVTGTAFTLLAPALYQTFFIGEGRQGDASGAVQQFYVPAGATRLFLGIPDAAGFGGPPGGYGDNSGTFTASLMVLVPYPQIIAPQLTGTNFSFAFQTLTNQSYTIQQTTNLAGGNWNFYTNFIGDGMPYLFTVPVGNSHAQFFRVREP